MVEDGLLIPEIGIPNLASRCTHMDDNESDIPPTKKESELAILKFICGIVLSILKKNLIISTGSILIIFIFFWLYGLIISLVLLICGLLAVVYQISDELLYWPNYPPDSRLIVSLPSSIGLPCENLYLYAKDGTKIHAVFIKQDDHAVKSVPTLIYLHGNAGNMGHRLGNVYDLYRFLGINILMLDYRGYGLSQGYPSEYGLYLDAQAAICYLRTRNDIDVNKIIVFGRSLGGAVAVDCVSRTEIRSRVAGIIVENTFTSIPDMTKSLFSGVKILPSLPVWCHKNKFRSKMKMCRIVVPSLLLSGQADTLVPPHMMMELYNSCAASIKRLFQFENGSHNETWRCRGYYQAVGNFLDEIFHHKVQLKPFPPGVTCISEPQVL